MININNSKELTKSLTKYFNSKKFCILRNILLNGPFFFTNLSQGNILYHLKFFILTKNLNTAPTYTEMKQNLSQFFLLRFMFCQVIKHQSIQL